MEDVKVLTITVPVYMGKINDESALSSHRVEVRILDVRHKRAYHRMFLGRPNTNGVKPEVIREVFERIAAQLGELVEDTPPTQ